MANAVKDVGGAIASKIFSSILIFGIGFIIVVVLGVIMYYLLYYRRKFNILVKIRSERAGDPSVFFDKAAIIRDWKTRTKYFKLMDTKVELTVPPFKVIEKTDKGDYLEVWRKSEEEFVFLTPPKIDRTRTIKADGKLYQIADSEQKQIEGDMDWYFTRKEKIKKLIDPESLLMKVLPYLPLLLGGAIMIFILWILMDKLPAILAQLQTVSESLARATTAEVTPA